MYDLNIILLVILFCIMRKNIQKLILMYFTNLARKEKKNYHNESEKKSAKIYWIKKLG